MFRTVLLPLDGSELAERAVPYATRLAQANQGKVVLVRAALAPPANSLDGAEWEREQLAAIDEAQEYLHGVAQRISAEGASVETVTPYGHAAEKIIESIAEYDADCVVIATHGRTGFQHLLYGSVAEAVLASSSVPVFAVYARPSEVSATAFAPAHARILVAQDGSENDPAALRTAVNLLGPCGALVLVAVAAPPERVQRDDTGRVIAYVDQQEEARTREARDYLSRVARQLGIASVKTDVRIGDAASGIAMAAIDYQADLIVMSTHGRTGVTRALVGSVAGTVLRTVNVPVVLVHPQPVPLE